MRLEIYKGEKTVMNNDVQIIGGGLFFTEIEVENDIEEHIPSEADKEEIAKNIEVIEHLKMKKGVKFK